ncbi:MAG TPA: hypothetical protein VJ371_20325, partial [Streptosporangiaceae bacterium]|nr:hypothetical protein [Streptosporangiaceae bacterium]
MSGDAQEPAGGREQAVSQEQAAGREQAAAQEPPGGQTWAQDAVDAAGGLDLLLTDAALGVTRRLRPD